MRSFPLVLAIFLIGCLSPSESPTHTLTNTTVSAAPSATPILTATTRANSLNASTTNNSPSASSLRFDLQIVDQVHASDQQAGHVTVQAEATNLGGENLTIWWPPCQQPFGMSIRDANGTIYVPYNSACQPQPGTMGMGRPCMDPCSFDYNASQPETGARELAPNQTYEATYTFPGWVQQGGSDAPWTWLPAGNLSFLATARWYGDDHGGIQANASFEWTTEDANPSR